MIAEEYLNRSRPRDRPAAPVRSFRTARARLAASVRDPDAARLVSRGDRYRAAASVRDTYWYLSACPELMQEAARRLDRLWEAKP